MLTFLACAAVWGTAAINTQPAQKAKAEPVLFAVIDRSMKVTEGELVSLRDAQATLKVAGKEVTVRGVVGFAVAGKGGGSRWGPERTWPGLPSTTAGGSDHLESPSLAGAPAVVRVSLTDGSLLNGDLLKGKGDDGLLLVHKLLGRVDFPIDSLRALLVGRGNDESDLGGAEGKEAGDTVVLTNGDRLNGFVESIRVAKDGATSAALEVVVERTEGGNKAKTAVPMERVESVVLRGGSATKAAKTVWFAGSEKEKTGATEFSTDNGEVRLVRQRGALAAAIRLADIEGALLEPGAVVALASCHSTGKVETGPEQPLGTRDLTMPEPEQASWRLPKGAKRITGWAVLPEECRQWGDCTVTVSVGEQQGKAPPIASFALNGASPVQQIDAELPFPGAETELRLTVTVGEGKNGPVQDRVVLRRVLVGIADK